ncbi:MAG: phenylalanine--tRNA ligase beta subunit-related protein [Lachnospiraceae bacterium]
MLCSSLPSSQDSVRKTARSFGKSTDASARYEKGVDEYSTVLGMKRALHLIEELGCGKVSSTHVDINTGNSIEPTENEGKYFQGQRCPWY